MDHKAVIDHITNWLRDYCTKTGQKGFVLGISGGVDSALVSTLCARTGLKTVTVEIPIHQARSQVIRAEQHVQWLCDRFPNVEVQHADLSATLDSLIAALPKADTQANTELALANARSRMRMTTLYYFAGFKNCLVAGTGNKVEDFGVGFFTKYGDGGVDISPIADLTKTEVFALAKHLGIVDSILEAKPTDGLFGDDRSDEDQIGASYPELEWAMDLRAKALDRDVLELSERQRIVLAIYDRRHAANRHKMDPIPTCIIPPELRG